VINSFKHLKRPLSILKTDAIDLAGWMRSVNPSLVLNFLCAILSVEPEASWISSSTLRNEEPIAGVNRSVRRINGDNLHKSVLRSKERATLVEESAKARKNPALSIFRSDHPGRVPPRATVTVAARAGAGVAWPGHRRAPPPTASHRPGERQDSLAGD
jgi:hypothetical protein